MNILSKVYIILEKPESAGGAGMPCVYSLLPNKETVTYLKMVSIINEHLGHCIKLLQSILTLKRLYLELCIMCFQALHRGAAGFILTLQFGKISKFFFTRIRVYRKCSTCSVNWPTFL